MRACSDVIVVGGGASGLVAAIAAAREGAVVTVLEKRDRVGKKILATGNGRCNLSNAAIGCETKRFGAASYNDPDFVTPVLTEYDCVRIRDFFKSIGLPTVVDERGWVFPRTRYANSVSDVLIRSCIALEVSIMTDSEVKEIHFDEKSRVENPGCRWRVQTATNDYLAESVVLCSETPAPATTLDLAVTALRPILGPLPVEAASLRGLDGVRVGCRVSLQNDGETVVREEGEVLFKKQELSGIVIFNISRWTKPGNRLALDMFPEHSIDELVDYLSAVGRPMGGDAAPALGGGLNAAPDLPIQHSASYRESGMPLSELLKGAVHSRLAQAVVRESGLAATQVSTPEAIRKVAGTLKDFRVTVTGGVDKNRAQVTRGGLMTARFDPRTLGSLKYPSLFAAGECLDIDGACGGFNLHWAWASGLVAGREAARYARIACRKGGLTC